jgi:hypothetical protein
MSAAMSLSLAEKVEIHTALLMREEALNAALKRMAEDKNPRAYDALKDAYYKSLRIIAGLKSRVAL